MLQESHLAFIAHITRELFGVHCTARSRTSSMQAKARLEETGTQVTGHGLGVLERCHQLLCRPRRRRQMLREVVHRRLLPLQGQTRLMPRFQRIRVLHLKVGLI